MPKGNVMEMTREIKDGQLTVDVSEWLVGTGGSDCPIVSIELY